MQLLLQLPIGVRTRRLFGHWQNNLKPEGYSLLHGTRHYVYNVFPENYDSYSSATKQTP